MTSRFIVALTGVMFARRLLQSDAVRVDGQQRGAAAACVSVSPSAMLVAAPPLRATLPPSSCGGGLPTAPRLCVSTMGHWGACSMAPLNARYWDGIRCVVGQSYYGRGKEIEGFSRDFVLNKLFETRHFKCLCYWKCVRLAYINTAQAQRQIQSSIIQCSFKGKYSNILAPG